MILAIRADARSVRWFRRGAAALQIAAPGARWAYRCPVCLGDFDTPGQLTVEHVPGSAVGGKPMVLTCGPCNHGAGHRLDAHVATADRLRRHKAGTADLRGLRGTIEVDGKQPVNATFTLTADTVAPTIDYRQNDPEAWRSLLEHMQQLAPEATPNGRMTIFPPRTDDAAAKAGWLRAAYLCAFAAFGYRYILDSALAPVRQQVEHPGGDLAGFGVNNADAVDDPQLVVIGRPLELRAVLVRMRDVAVLLPRPGDVDFYQRLNSETDEGRRANFEGLLVPWPTEPDFRMDFNPPGRGFPQ